MADSMQKTEIEDKRSPLEKLSSGLLMQTMHREAKEPEYSVIDRVTFGHVVVQRRSAYVSEIKRVIEELELTLQLISEVNETTTLKVGDNVKYTEELLDYYNGVFLGLVHQLKDKLLRYLDYQAADENTKTRFQEAQKVKIGKHAEIIKEIGIDELVELWNQENRDSPIVVVLKKRTNHHHFTSTTRLNKDFQNIRFARTTLTSPMAESLNDIGKEYMKKLGKDSFEKYRNDLVKKQQESLALIVSNINSIAEKVAAYYGVPTDYESQAKLAAEYVDFLGSLEIKNEASLSKLPKVQAASMEDIKKLTDAFGDKLIAAYGVGSYFRDEFNVGSSDINIYLVIKGDTVILDNEMPATFYAINEDEFLSDKHKKERFICWADGVLITGKDYKWTAKDFPKPGTELAVMLNEGVVERLEELKVRIKSFVPGKLGMVELRLLQLKATKQMLDYLFGVAISNKPMYTSSRKRRVEHIKEAFGIMPLTLTLERAYFTHKPFEKNSYCDLIDAFLVQARRNIAKQEAILKEPIKQA